jgi:DNA-binding transcriptional LysR family regulator
LHFGRAAQRLHLAQPPLSQQIRKLEEILGYQLFVRTSRAVQLTNAGEVFLDRARRTLRNVQEDIDEVRSIGRGDVGFLRVGFIGSSMLTRVPEVLGRYRQQFPKVQLVLQEAHSALLEQSLLKGALDAAFLRDGDPVPDLEIEPLCFEEFIAVLPHTHPLAARKSISVGQLRKDPFVFFSPSAGKLAYERTISLCLEHGFRPNVVQEAPQWLTILRLVGAGLGVTIAPECVRQVASPNVACIKLRGAKLRSQIELAFRSGDDRGVFKAFAQVVRASFRAGDEAKPVRQRCG